MLLSLRAQRSALSALALLLVTIGAHAQTIVDNFDDGTATGWTQIDPLENGIYSFPNGTSYRIQAPTSPDSGTYGAARAGAIRLDQIFTDFTVTVDLVDWDNQSDTHQSIGIFARGGDYGIGSTDGYFFHYDPFGSGGGASLWIDRITNEAPDSASSQIGIDRLNPGEGYRLEFIGVRSSLIGRVYNLNNLLDSLYEVTLDDSTYAFGTVGLLVSDQGQLTTGNQFGDATFDNFRAVGAVPEPATVASLCGLAVFGFAVCRRRARSNPRN